MKLAVLAPQFSGGAFVAGRTDAGRPGLPLPLEVYS
jgi:hypothetical protein